MPPPISRKKVAQFRAAFGGEIQDLASIYHRASADALAVLSDASASLAARGTAVEHLRQYQRIMAQMNDQAAAWIETNVPIAYQIGLEWADENITALRKAGINLDRPQRATFAGTHAEAVNAIATRMQEALTADDYVTSAISQIGRRVPDVFRAVGTQEVAAGIAGGKSRVQVSKAIEKRLLDEAAPTFVDRGGRTWALETYAEMVARTTTREAMSTGTLWRLKEHGIELVQFSAHNAADFCAYYENCIANVGDEPHPLYPPLSAYGGAPPWHPNCVHVMFPFVDKLATEQERAAGLPRDDVLNKNPRELQRLYREEHPTGARAYGRQVLAADTRAQAEQAAQRAAVERARVDAAAATRRAADEEARRAREEAERVAREAQESAEIGARQEAARAAVAARSPSEKWDFWLAEGGVDRFPGNTPLEVTTAMLREEGLTASGTFADAAEIEAHIAQRGYREVWLAAHTREEAEAMITSAMPVGVGHDGAGIATGMRGWATRTQAEAAAGPNGYIVRTAVNPRGTSRWEDLLDRHQLWRDEQMAKAERLQDEIAAARAAGKHRLADEIRKEFDAHWQMTEAVDAFYTEDIARFAATRGIRLVVSKEGASQPYTLIGRSGLVADRNPISLRPPRAPRVRAGGVRARGKLSAAVDQQGIEGAYRAGGSLHHAGGLANAEDAKDQVVKGLAERLRNNADFRRLYTQVAGMGSHGGRYTTQLEECIDKLIGSWAGTSGDNNPIAIAMQLAAREEFGLTKATLWWPEDKLRIAREYMAAHGKGYRAFVRAMYERTQQTLEAAGVEELTLFRGFTLQRSPSGRTSTAAGLKALKANPRLQPMSSFSSNVDTAAGFASESDPFCAVAVVKVPRARIIGYTRTGYGCLSEQEFVLLAGDGDEALLVGWNGNARWRMGSEYGPVPGNLVMQTATRYVRETATRAAGTP